MTTAPSPGLYRATVRGVPGESIVMVGDGGSFTFSLDTEGNVRRCYVFTDARPLIVLDLEDPAETVRHMRSESASWDEIELIADQIEAQTKPARIPEPEHIGARITAASGKAPDIAEVMPWTRFSTILLANWIDGAGRRRQWGELIDPILIRGGA